MNGKSILMRAVDKYTSTGSPHEFGEELANGMTEITEKMMAGLNPICGPDIPMIIAACRLLEKTLTQHNPMDGRIADQLTEGMGSVLFQIPVPPGYKMR